MQRGLLWLVTCVCLLALLGQTSGTVQPFVRRDVSDSQWTYLLRQFKIWNGFWTRYSANGSVELISKVQRNFTQLSEDRWLHTNTYENPNWRPDGETVAKFIYLNTKPLPTYALRLYPNGTVGPETFSSAYIAFYPRQWGLTSSRTIAGGGSFFFEIYVPNPIDSLTRVTIACVYVGGTFQFMTAVREVSAPATYPARGFTLETDALVITGESGIKLPGLWARVKDCIMPPLKYTKRVGFVQNGTIPFPVAPHRVSLQLPNSISVSYPRTLSAFRNDAFTVFYSVWKVNNRTVVVNQMGVGKDRSLARNCVTTYYRIE